MKRGILAAIAFYIGWIEFSDDVGYWLLAATFPAGMRGAKHDSRVVGCDSVWFCRCSFLPILELGFSNSTFPPVSSVPSLQLATPSTSGGTIE